MEECKRREKKEEKKEEKKNMHGKDMPIDRYINININTTL